MNRYTLHAAISVEAANLQEFWAKLRDLEASAEHSKVKIDWMDLKTEPHTEEL